MAELWKFNEQTGRNERVTADNPLPVETRGEVALSGYQLCLLGKGRTPSTTITCTLASTDYAASAPIPGGTRFIGIFASADCTVAVGDATSASVGQGVQAGMTLLPVKLSADPGENVVHAQSATAGATVRLTYYLE
jgi:hypothetical protein